MTALEELKGIYSEYEEKLAKVAEAASVFAGAFHMRDDPRNHACNELFYEKAEQWAADFSQSDASAEDAAEAVRWILNYSAQNRESRTYWYTYAAQKHAAGLIPMLRPADAGSILEAFSAQYEKKNWLPVQEELVKLLKKQAGAADRTENTGWLQTWGRRVVLLLVGLTIAHLGVTLFLLADLGSDPFNVMIQGLHRMAGIASHGTIHVAVSLLIILALLVIDRSYVRIGTFLCMILGGPIIDMFTWLLGGVVNSSSGMGARILAVVLGCGILAFGMTIVIKSQAGTGPNDLVAVVISDKRRWKFGIVRIAVDVCFALIGFALGGTVGLGTVICVAVVGPVAQVFMPFSEKLCGRVLQEQ